MTLVKLLSSLLCLMLLTSCSLMHAELKEPEVTLVKIELLPLRGMNPEFKITLDVYNPNDYDIELAQLSYQLLVQDQQLFTGKNSDIPSLTKLQHQQVSLRGTAKLFSSFKVLKAILKHPEKAVQYQLSAQLDYNELLPTYDFAKQGSFIPLAKSK